MYRFKPSLSEDIKNADLVISHAGNILQISLKPHQKYITVYIYDDLVSL